MAHFFIFTIRLDQSATAKMRREKSEASTLTYGTSKNKGSRKFQNPIKMIYCSALKLFDVNRSNTIWYLEQQLIWQNENSSIFVYYYLSIFSKFFFRKFSPEGSGQQRQCRRNTPPNTASFPYPPCLRYSLVFHKSKSCVFRLSICLLFSL